MAVNEENPTEVKDLAAKLKNLKSDDPNDSGFVSLELNM